MLMHVQQVDRAAHVEMSAQSIGLLQTEQVEKKVERYVEQRCKEILASEAVQQSLQVLPLLQRLFTCRCSCQLLRGRRPRLSTRSVVFAYHNAV